MIIGLCCEKGGTGKSSLAQSFATYLLTEQDVDVLLVDADPQRTTADWASERSETGLPPLPCVQLSGNITKDLLGLQERYSVIVVDTAGTDSKAMRSTLSVADIVLIPFRPKRRDLKVAPSMAELCETMQAGNPTLMVRSVVTQTPTLPNQDYRIHNAKKLLQELGLNPLIHTTRNLNSWDDAEESGCSVLEYKGDHKAGDDARAVFNEILEALRKVDE